MLKSMQSFRQTGFTLIEVLVSVVILGLGLLGLAGLIATSSKNSHSAYLRSEATILTYGMLDIMRANLCAARDGDYAIDMASSPPTATTPAEQQLSAWMAEVAARLPSGDAQIRHASSCVLNAAVVNIPNCDGAPAPVAIVIQWNDQRGIGGGETQQFCTVSQI